MYNIAHEKNIRSKCKETITVSYSPVVKLYTSSGFTALSTQLPSVHESMMPAHTHAYDVFILFVIIRLDDQSFTPKYKPSGTIWRHIKMKTNKKEIIIKFITFSRRAVIILPRRPPLWTFRWNSEWSRAQDHSKRNHTARAFKNRTKLQVKQKRNGTEETNQSAHKSVHPERQLNLSDHSLLTPSARH